MRGEGLVEARRIGTRIRGKEANWNLWIGAKRRMSTRIFA